MRQRRYLRNLVNSTHGEHAYRIQNEESAKVNAKWEKRREETRTQTDLLHTHFFVVLDLIFGDDAVGLVGFLPGELDAALLHLLLDDLTDLGRSCSDKECVNKGQSRPPHPTPPRHPEPEENVWIVNDNSVQLIPTFPAEQAGTYSPWWQNYSESLLEGCTCNLLTPALCTPIISGSLHDSFEVSGCLD